MPDNQRCMSHTRRCLFFFWGGVGGFVLGCFFGKKKRGDGRIKQTFMTVRVSEVFLIPRSRGFHPCFPSISASPALPPGEEKSRIDTGGYYKCGFTATAKQAQVSTASILVMLFDGLIFFSPPWKTCCVKSFGELASVLHSFSFIPFICLARSPRHRTLRYSSVHPPPHHPTTPAPHRTSVAGGGGGGQACTASCKHIYCVNTAVARAAERQ